MFGLESTLSLPGCILSFGGSVCFMILEYLSYRKINKHASAEPIERLKEKTRKLKMFYLFNLGASDIIFSLSFFLGLIESSLFPSLCKYQAMMMEFGALSSVLWSFAVSLFFYSTCDAYQKGMGWNDYKHKAKRRYKFSSVLCYGIPFTCVLINTATNRWDQVGDWCWISYPPGWFLFLYLWVFLVFIGNSILLIQNQIETRRIRSLIFVDDEENEDPGLVHKTGARLMIGFIAAFYAVWLFAIIDRGYQLLFGHQVQWITYVHVATVPLQGVWNCLVYVFVHKKTIHKHKYVPVGVDVEHLLVDY